MSAGRETIIHTYSAGDHANSSFGELPLGSGRPHAASIVAKTDGGLLYAVYLTLVQAPLCSLHQSLNYFHNLFTNCTALQQASCLASNVHNQASCSSLHTCIRSSVIVWCCLDSCCRKEVRCESALCDTSAGRLCPGCSAVMHPDAAGVLFQLDAKTFRSVVTSTRGDSKALIKTLRSISVLQPLSVGQLEQLAQVMVPVSHNPMSCF